MKTDEKGKGGRGPAVRVAIISLLVCGLFFPLLITGVAQILMPYQANGELQQLGGRNVGSNLVDNNFTLPLFFHARPANVSASGVDPDITLQDAYSQIPRISKATGIPAVRLREVVDQNTEGLLWIFGSPYVNVLRVNLVLIKTFPSVFSGFE